MAIRQHGKLQPSAEDVTSETLQSIRRSDCLIPVLSGRMQSDRNRVALRISFLSEYLKPFPIAMSRTSYHSSIFDKVLSTLTTGFRCDWRDPCKLPSVYESGPPQASLP